jgi:hypothetical protein
MRSSLYGAVACFALCIFACEARAEADPLETSPVKHQIKGKREILLNRKFQPPIGTDKAAGPDKAAAAPAALTVGDGYGSVRYSIGTRRQKEAIKQVIQGLALTLPAKFGNSAGTYVISITVTDQAGKMLAKEPILSFQWTKERQLFFIEKTVSEVQKTTWNGTLVDRMLLNSANQRLKVSLEASLQQDRSLDFEFIKKAAKAYGASALAAYYPLPTVALPIIESITSLLNDLYARSVKKSLVEEEEIVFVPGAPAIRADIVYTDDSQMPHTVPVLISIETQPSVIAPDLTFPSPKFEKTNLSEVIFNNTRVAIADGKSAGVAELIPQSSEARFRGTGKLLETVQAAKIYSESDTALRCGDLYEALNAYLSKYDARAMFWAFLQKYGSFVQKDACLGGRKGELEAVGL